MVHGVSRNQNTWIDVLVRVSKGPGTLASPPYSSNEGLALKKVFRRMLQVSSAGCWSAEKQQKLLELLSYTLCWRC